ncbi:glutamine--fructose-6-phosphate transaminase (isomerizing) [Thermogladius sp. 4427co]|uniref:glutamine--fructose-6-phosphate transaminase (isomerizing) n=1 Tax=Thermogladius sp. 4427co TaxID=3450718 RepID=UPI003F7B1AA2
MCGIIGVCASPGRRLNTGEMVFKGLLRLEYRGYDSAGVASIESGVIKVLKGKGRIADLEKKLGFSRVGGSVVIGHTRWATHGAPSDENAHPHTDCTGSIAIVHNGIIENYRELREALAKKGHVFKSETDTEVVAHLIEEYLKTGLAPYEAFKKAISSIRGSYAILAVFSSQPDTIFFAKKDSPLVIGLGEGFNMVASDIPALLEYTRRVITVRDMWVGYITGDSVFIEELGKGPVEPSSYVRVVEWDLESASKGGYQHFMIKEIHEQPRALAETFYGALSDLSLGEAAKILLDARRIYITAAGTSYHASLHFALSMGRISKILVTPFIASEYESYAPTAREGDVLIAVSQSGETMDTLKAVRAFKERGARVIAVSNVVDSAIPRESDLPLYTRAGPEIGVAATKTFTTQTLLLSLLALEYGLLRGELLKSEYEELRKELSKSSELASKTISWSEGVARKIAEFLRFKNSIYYLSRGIGLPTAMEGALKIKEIAYIHAEAYPAGESKHGPIALVEKDFPVVFVVPRDEYYEKLILGNIQEMKARGAFIIGVAPEDSKLLDLFDICIKTPASNWLTTPITHTPPLQLVAYYTSVYKGFDPDKPRNLAKTVTVE